MIDLTKLTIERAHKLLAAGEITSVELVGAYQQVIEKKNRDLNAYLEVFDDCLLQAKAADKRVQEGTATALTGIPVAVKDNILIKGNIASAASRILENHVATYDATVIAKLREAGAVFVGRTNMDEFAFGSSTENSAFGVTRNPHDTTRVAGGTSGGSAAAVASSMTMVALGSDTGGSIRAPASFCGIIGLKPTYGAVSRSGLIAAASSLEGVAPAGRTVSDVQALFYAIKGHDPLDSTTNPESLYQKRKAGTDKFVVGVPSSFLEQSGIREEVFNNFKESVEKLKNFGYVIKDVELPHIEYSVPVYYIIIFAEESTNLARFDGVKYGLHKNGKNLIDDYFTTRGEGFGDESRRRLILGAYVLSAGYYDAYYNKANGLRQLIKDDFSNAFNAVDIVAMPTMPGPAFKVGEKVEDPVSMYLEDIFTVAANLTGLPAISLPSGFVEEDGKKLPLGLQLMASHMQEDILFAVGKQFLGE